MPYLVLQALGFVGPSYVVRDPSSVWACAVHQADVLFFWDAAQEWKVAEVNDIADPGAAQLSKVVGMMLCSLQNALRLGVTQICHQL